MVSVTEERGAKKTRALLGAAAAYEAGAREMLHVHPEDGQLKWPGLVAAVQTPRGIFVLPAGAAVWIPPNERHRGLYSSAVEERSLYVYREHCARLPAECCAVRITPRIAEVMGLFVRQHRENGGGCLDAEPAALAVLHEEVLDAGVAPLPITIPEGSSISVVTNGVLANPTLVRTLLEWSKLLGMSQSSLDRAFRRDTGLALGTWCRRARLLHALHRLASGVEVASVAREVGYGTSAFVHMFRKTLGTTPGRYFSALAAGQPGQAARDVVPTVVSYASGVISPPARWS